MSPSTDGKCIVKFKVLMAADMMTVFWDVAPYSLVEIDQRFRDTYLGHILPDYMA
jgi:hypothetical protein